MKVCQLCGSPTLRVARGLCAGCYHIEDLEGSDVLVSFTGNGGGGKGGRHIEHGYFLAGSPFLRVVIVGPRENIFHCHPNTDVYPDWATFLAAEVSA